MLFKVKPVEIFSWFSGEAGMDGCQCHSEHCVWCQLAEVRRGIRSCVRQVSQGKDELTISENKWSTWQE